MTLKKLPFSLLFGAMIFSAVACTGGGDEVDDSQDDDGFWDDDDSGWDDDDDGGGDCGGSFSGQVTEGVDGYHSFSVDTDRDVVYTLEWDGDADLDLHLLDSSGNEVTRAETDGGGTGEELELWTQAGNYQVMVVMWDEDDTDYELDVSCE